MCLMKERSSHECVNESQTFLKEHAACFGADDNGDIGQSELSELHILITDWWLVKEPQHNDFPRAPYGNSAVLTKTTLDVGSSGHCAL